LREVRPLVASTLTQTLLSELYSSKFGLREILLNTGAFDSTLKNISFELHIIVQSASSNSATKTFSQDGILFISISKIHSALLIVSVLESLLRRILTL